jgi:hypothetical protein
MFPPSPLLEGNVVVCGDFNMDGDFYFQDFIEAGLKDTAAQLKKIENTFGFP